MADPASPRPRRIWRIVLVLSLALNIAVVGLVAGFVLREGRSGPPRGIALALGPIGQALEPGDRRAILRALRDNPDLKRPRNDGSRGPVAGVEPMIAALSADPFSPQDFEQSLLIGDERMFRLRDAVRAALIAQVNQMSTDERAAFAARLAAAPKRRR